jgi:hypothetical protein
MFIAVTLFLYVLVMYDYFTAATLLFFAFIGSLWYIVGSAFFETLTGMLLPLALIVPLWLFIGYWWAKFKLNKTVKKLVQKGFNISRLNIEMIAGPSKFIGWVCWWPLSALAYLTKDSVIEFTRFLERQYDTLVDKILTKYNSFTDLN